MHVSCVSNPICPFCKANLPLKRPAESSENSKKSAILQVSKYPLLTQIIAIDLQKRLDKLHESTQDHLSTLSEDTKVRYNFKDKVLTALILSEAENRAQRCNFQSPDLKLMSKIAKEVESSLFLTSGKTVKSGNYIRRARMLAFNLLDEKNSELRGNLLRGEIKPGKLAYMESKELASSAMKQLREERERRYVEEQLIKPTDMDKVIVKTHKGEGIIDIGDLESREGDNDAVDKEEQKTGEEGEKVKVRIKEIARENSMEVIAAGIRRRLKLYLKEEQVEMVLKTAGIEE